jgi:hypothetical protein
MEKQASTNETQDKEKNGKLAQFHTLPVPFMNEILRPGLQKCSAR